MTASLLILTAIIPGLSLAFEMQNVTGTSEPALFEDDCTSLFVTEWKNLFAPNEGAYITDYSNSVGNPNNVAFKPVENGQYLIYGDEAGSAAGKYSWITKNFPIGTGAWELQLQAKILDLITPAGNYAYRGLSFEIYANNKKYKITFNDRNKVLVMTSAAGSYIQKEIAMPADQGFHSWSFTFDGTGKLYIKLDGAVAAEFDYSGFDSVQSEGMTVVNAPLQWQRGSTEVYLDEIKMIKLQESMPYPEQESEYTEISVPKGMNLADTNPETGPLGQWGFNYGFALDYKGRSIGVDYLKTEKLEKIELWDDNASSNYKRTSPPTYDYLVYISQDNITYTKITEITDYQVESTVIDGKSVHIFTFDNILARYVKIATTATYTSGWSFVLNPFQKGIKVYKKVPYIEISTPKGAAFNDITPEDGKLERFGANISVNLDVWNTSVGIDLKKASNISYLEIIDTDLVNRLTKESYKIYISNDNLQYSPLADWSFKSLERDGKAVHQFRFNNLKTRYIKLTSTISDENYTFEISDLQEAIKVYALTYEDFSVLNEGTLFEYTPMQAAAGFAQNDTEPETGVLAGFGAHTEIVPDTYGCSVGIDMNNVRKIGKIELWDSDDKSTLSSEQYRILASNDNMVYTEITDWKFDVSVYNGRKVHCILFNNTVARYIKLTTTSNDGTFLLADIQTDVKAYGSYTKSYGICGFIEGDYVPQSGKISSWSPSTPVALDYNKRSIGIDLGETKAVGKIELVNRSSSTRITQSDYSLYISDDNEAYTKVDQWQFRESVVNGQLVHVFILPEISTRYVKIGTRYEDTGSNYTFVTAGLLSDSLLAYTVNSYYEPLKEGIKSKTGYLNSDLNPADTPISDWTAESPVFLDTESRSIGIDMGMPVKICKIELIDSDLNSTIPPSGYKLYISTDNIHYTQIAYWNYETYISVGRRVHSLEFNADTTARYIKVNAGINNTTPTLELSSIGRDVKVYLSPDKNLPVSTELPTQTSALRADLDKSIIVDFLKLTNVYKIEILNAVVSDLISIDSFKLYKSEDGKHYKPVDLWKFSIVSSEGLVSSVFELQNTCARFIKIEIIDGNEAGFVISNQEENIKGYGNIYSELLNSTVTIDGGLNADIGKSAKIGKIEIWNYDAVNNPNPSDIKISASIDNIYYYEAVVYDYKVRTVDGIPVISFMLNGTLANYIKVYMLTTGQENIELFSSPVVMPINTASGLVRNDIDPANTPASQFGIEVYNAPVDRDNTSICIGLNSIQPVNRVEIYDNDVQAQCSKENFDLYYSLDNATYKRIREWKLTPAISNRRLIYIFEFAGIDAKFLKINYNSADGLSSLIINDLKRDVKAYSMEDLGQIHLQDSKVPAILGYCEFDYAPENGAVEFWGVNDSFEFDKNLRSIAADLGEIKTFNKIKLYDNDHETVLRKDLFSLYVSDDNISYRRLENWDMFKAGNVITFYNFSSAGRYVKVHQHLNLTSANGISSTFVSLGNSFQKMMEVYNEEPQIWTLSGGGRWKFFHMLKVDNMEPQDVYDRAVYISKEDAGIPKLLSQGFVNSDLSDIRFSDENNRELSYYEDDNGFYVRISFLARGGSAKIYMFYGNPGALKRSDGDSTFHVEYGTKTFDIPQTGGNAKFIKMNNGNLMVVYGWSETTPGNVDVYGRISTDNGKSWSEQRLIADAGIGDNPGAAQVLPDGEIVLVFFNVEKYTTTNSLTQSKCDLYYTRSSDNGETWSSPVKIDTGWNYCLTMTNPIRIDIGEGKFRIIVPFHYVYLDDGSFRSSVMYSDDGGYTWTKSISDIQKDSLGFEGGATECTIIQLSDESLKMYYRVQDDEVTHLGETVSTDNGLTWSGWKDSILYSANTQPAMIRDNENIMIMWAGNNSFGGGSYVRTPLNIAYSQDDTESWHGYRDVLAGTSLWSSGGKWLVTQPDMVAADDGSLNILWAHAFKFVPFLRIENMRDWLYKSHGGYNDFESENVLYDYWWRLSGGIGISKEQSYRGLASLKLQDNLTSGSTQAARSFTTGLEKGTVKFKLYADNLDSEFNISLRECYSPSEDAPGNMFQLNVKPDGTLAYKKSENEYAVLPINTVINKNIWYDIEMRFNTGEKTCKILIDGEDKGNIDVYMNENIINYLYISSGMNDKTGTTVYIDDLIIIDNSVISPVLKKAE